MAEVPLGEGDSKCKGSEAGTSWAGLWPRKVASCLRELSEGG